ncbi:hypothetical protein GCM10018785_48180 [Streptomyces longispororuber]|uniref:ABC transporter substrate-binding protein n=1 Tax=Streptomyces longispororuber TaxID=68230 RepID=A0A918ZWS1_9ACTN|nr:extracellular solute-binding protein [Streptomyces longispororuber]GHE74337.1 hypothetical protein GCM10018785_48180 [Streptomyces longispororuber]
MTHLSRHRPGRCTAAALALLLAASACTGGGGDGRADDVSDGAADGGTIVIASGRDVTGRGGVRQQLVDAWNEQQRRRNSGYTARLVELPGTADQQRSQLLGALQSGSSAYDVVNLDVTWVPEFAAAKAVRELDPRLVDGDVVPSVAATARWKGAVYAVPFNSDVGVLYYRKDYVRAAGVRQSDGAARAKDWDDFKGLIETVDKAEEDDLLPAAYEKGWTTQLDAYEGLTVNGVEAFASAGAGVADLVDGKGAYDGTVSQLEEGLAELRSRAAGAYTFDGVQDSDEARSLADFTSGRTAFLRHWPYAYGTLHQILPKGALGVTALPGKAVLGGQNLAVARTSRHRKAILDDLVAYLTGKESERCLLEAGFAATRASAYTKDPPMLCTVARPSPSGGPSGSGEAADQMPREPDGRPEYAAPVLLPALKAAVQRPRTQLYGVFTQVFSAELHKLFGDNPRSVGEVAKRLDETLRRALPERD